MKICVVQTKPIKSDIKSNIETHKRLIDHAITNKADLIVFPELSLTGYEPELSKELATNQDDSRLDDFQEISNDQKIIIGVGIPTQNENGICISMFFFSKTKRE